MQKYIPNFNIPTREYKNYSQEEIINLPNLDLPTLCKNAGVKLRVTQPSFEKVYLDNTSDKNFVSPFGYVVGTKKLPQDNSAFRIIEVLAYGFFDYAARETICHKGYFKVQ